MVINWKKLPEMFKIIVIMTIIVIMIMIVIMTIITIIMIQTTKRPIFKKRGTHFILGWGYGGMVSLLHEKGASFSEFPQITGNREPKIG